MPEDEEQLEPQTLLRSEVEDLKEHSNHLRGTIKETLESDTSHFSEDEYQLLKFHGVYQQDDRDMRAAARKQGRDKEWIMMIRAKIPGGVVTPDQYLVFDDLSSRYADGTLRATTRQCFQLHHVGKVNLKRTIREINESLITTLGACGDVERNLMACPAPNRSAAVTEVQRYARLLSDQTLPQTRAYHEIWLDHERVSTTEQPEIEPLYGEVYMPRKFKTGLAIDGDNCIDVYSQDVGIVAHIDDGKLSGFTFMVGGGMGRTHTDPNTRPRTADPICFVEPDDMLNTFLAILKVQRDNGNRISRRQARLKYLVASNGLGRVKGEMERWVGHRLAPPRELHWEDTHDHLGWHEQHDGRWYLGVFIENGRIQDADGMQQKTAFRKIIEEFRPEVRLTPQQSIMFCNIEARDRDDVERLLRNHGVPLVEEISTALRYSMACPAVPTCGLALAESEREMPGLVRRIESIMGELGLADERLSIRMTGCPNGCARPYLGDIGFVGRTPGKYQVYLGGDFEGTRLNSLVADLVPAKQLAEMLRPIFVAFRDERQTGEAFGNFCNRVGRERLRELALSTPELAGVAR
jgi:sulfite reductase (ferredoxin)